MDNAGCGLAAGPAGPGKARAPGARLSAPVLLAQSGTLRVPDDVLADVVRARKQEIAPGR